jgi:hypothetical protein
MRFAPTLVQRIVALHRTGRVEVRWATTWVDDIEQIRLLMGLPRWPCALSLRGSESADGPAVLLVRPDPARGLQPHHLDEIEAFVETWAGTTDVG